MNQLQIDEDYIITKEDLNGKDFTLEKLEEVLYELKDKPRYEEKRAMILAKMELPSIYRMEEFRSAKSLEKAYECFGVNANKEDCTQLREGTFNIYEELIQNHSYGIRSRLRFTSEGILVLSVNVE